MKIDNVLAMHPWPWRLDRDDHVWGIRDSNNEIVMGDEYSYAYGDVPDAIVELVASHVNRTTTQRTHSPGCWQWHLECAVSKIKGMSEEKP